MLQCYVEKSHEWRAFLPCCCLLPNNKHASIGVTPFVAMFGRNTTDITDSAGLTMCGPWCNLVKWAPRWEKSIYEYVSNTSMILFSLLIV